jgi:AcrR family transcriptional regulator
VRVLAAHGDTGQVSIRAVAAQPGVTPPAVYRVFPDRRALIHAAVETCFDRFAAHLAQASHGVASPFDALRQRWPPGKRVGSRFAIAFASAGGDVVPVPGVSIPVQSP